MKATNIELKKNIRGHWVHLQESIEVMFCEKEFTKALLKH